MKNTQSLILLFILPVSFLLLCGGCSSAGVGHRKLTLTGGWKPIIDVNDGHVQDIGQFAVAEHNREANSDLKFENVVTGETQVVTGINYRLVISAKKGDVAGNYEAVVWEKSWENYRNLKSFKPA